VRDCLPVSTTQRRSDRDPSWNDIWGPPDASCLSLAVTYRADTLRIMDYTHLIAIEPGKRGGQPCIRGMRITVRDVLEYLAGGMTMPELLAEFPELTADDVRACLAFAEA
jgi:uncharacterized protein (DUF433 family)